MINASAPAFVCDAVRRTQVIGDPDIGTHGPLAEPRLGGC